jgi:hypothetical protein
LRALRFKFKIARGAMVSQWAQRDRGWGKS